MKKLLRNLPFMLLCVLLFSLNQCYYNNDYTARKSNISSEQNTNYIFIKVPFEEPSSYGYFSYNFDSYKNEIGNITEFLSYLSSRGVLIEAAWYFGGPSCGNTRTMVRPELFIKLSTTDYALLDYNFSYISDKPKINCIKER